MKAYRLWGDLKVETKETGQLAIALCHICVCFTQNKKFHLRSWHFLLRKEIQGSSCNFNQQETDTQPNPNICKIRAIKDRNK